MPQTYANRLTAILLLFMILTTGCATTKLTHENFAKIREGMSEQQVLTLLGEPTDSNSISTGSWFGIIDGLSGTSMVWETNEAKVDIIFVNGKVKTKNYKKFASF
ncbi:outer membrane protein assembly factor BamE [Candidatus Albibeggiatoa sp. nov. NOAA]|uniref:outer membrane protein assembly factor BamE domain-containing protein n=1 Tax=Candidatus Albibeggiatoa sp. nov. NOAA TaxID=3162724 RepID=UPI0033015479|nr:outer membrane protein assembly factor BamE [Thiotrichaceae bacterium]